MRYTAATQGMSTGREQEGPDLAGPWSVGESLSRRGCLREHSLREGWVYNNLILSLHASLWAPEYFTLIASLQIILIVISSGKTLTSHWGLDFFLFFS